MNQNQQQRLRLGRDRYDIDKKLDFLNIFLLKNYDKGPDFK